MSNPIFDHPKGRRPETLLSRYEFMAQLNDAKDEIDHLKSKLYEMTTRYNALVLEHKELLTEYTAIKADLMERDSVTIPQKNGEIDQLKAENRQLREYWDEYDESQIRDIKMKEREVLEKMDLED